MTGAAALVCFAFIGFDIVAKAAEKTRNPQRDMPIGILGSRGICTVLYVLVSLVVTGMVQLDRLSSRPLWPRRFAASASLRSPP